MSGIARGYSLWREKDDYETDEVDDHFLSHCRPDELNVIIQTILLILRLKNVSYSAFDSL
jgi:hypothetical protein